MGVFLLVLWLWDLAAGVLYAAPVARLGDDSFAVREAAAAVLADPAAYPALVRAAESSSCPEVRSAARHLAAPVAARLADLRCLWLVVGPPPDPKEFYADHAARSRLAYRCERLGLAADWPAMLRPENEIDPLNRWGAGRLPWHQPTQALAVIRRALRDQSRLWDPPGGP